MSYNIKIHSQMITNTIPHPYDCLPNLDWELKVPSFPTLVMSIASRKRELENKNTTNKLIAIVVYCMFIDCTNEIQMIDLVSPQYFRWYCDSNVFHFTSKYPNYFLRLLSLLVTDVCFMYISCIFHLVQGVLSPVKRIFEITKSVDTSCAELLFSLKWLVKQNKGYFRRYTGQNKHTLFRPISVAKKSQHTLVYLIPHCTERAQWSRTCVLKQFRPI